MTVTVTVDIYIFLKITVTWIINYEVHYSHLPLLGEILQPYWEVTISSRILLPYIFQIRYAKDIAKILLTNDRKFVLKTEQNEQMKVVLDDLPKLKQIPADDITSQSNYKIRYTHNAEAIVSTVTDLNSEGLLDYKANSGPGWVPG